MSYHELTDVANELCPLGRLGYLVKDPGIKVPGTAAHAYDVTHTSSKKNKTSCVYFTVAT